MNKMTTVNNGNLTEKISILKPARLFFWVVILLLILVVALWQISKSRTFQFFGKIVSRVATNEKIVALTFDDGPSAEFTEPVLAILRDKKVKGTFFLTGSEIEKNMKFAQMIAAENHEIGNHSFSHQRMILTGPEFVAEEIERTDSAIEAAGFKGRILFRPPYGKKLFTLPWYMAQKNRLTITWDLEPESYAVTADKIVDHVSEKVKPGSIILLHVMYKSRAETRKALPEIIDRLRQTGYEFVTVSELLQHEA